MTLAVLLILLTFVHNHASATDYCADEMKCKRGKEMLNHTACDCDFDPKCQDGDEYESSGEISNQYVTAHNNYREKVASGKETRGGIKDGATLMYVLQYDSDLEYVANCHNKKCIIEHDKCRTTQTFSSVGQNLFQNSGASCDWNKTMEIALKDWYNEIQLVTASCLNSFGCIAAGHFTQMVWAKTTHVGCSLVTYKNEKKTQCCQIACNYGPAGNVVKSEVFKLGSPASKCQYKSKKFPHLCLLTEDQEGTANSRQSNSKFIICLMLIYVLLQ